MEIAKKNLRRDFFNEFDLNLIEWIWLDECDRRMRLENCLINRSINSWRSKSLNICFLKFAIYRNIVISFLYLLITIQNKYKYIFNFVQ